MRSHRFLFALCCLLATAAFGKDPVIVGDQLTDDFLKVTLTKPAGWHFQTRTEKRAARSAIDYKNKGWAMMVRQASFFPRIVISKYPEPYAGLNPTFTLDRYPLEEDRFKDGLWVSRANAGLIEYMVFTPIRYVQLPQWVEIAGRKAGHYEAHFELEAKGIPTLEIKRKIWAVGSGGLSVIFVTAVGAQKGPEVADAELQSILDSLRFLP